jgi:outer membrane lipoprotein SlyB
MTKRFLVMSGMCIAFAWIFLMQGCQSTDKAYEGVVSVTDPDKMKVTPSMKWLNPQPRIRPVSADKMVVYCRIRNSSGADIDVSDAVKAEIEKLGYKFTNDVSQAQFTLSADVRYFGEGASKDLGPIVGGGVLGGVTGAVIGHQDNGHTAEGAVIGAAAGAALGNIVANRNKMRNINLVIDVVVGERVEGQKVATDRSANQESAVTHNDAVNKGGGAEVGQSSAGSSESQHVSVQEDFLYHENRLAASAQKLNLTLPEASAVMTPRIAKAIAGVLP